MVEEDTDLSEHPGAEHDKNLAKCSGCLAFETRPLIATQKIRAKNKQGFTTRRIYGTPKGWTDSGRESWCKTCLDRHDLVAEHRHAWQDAERKRLEAMRRRAGL